MISRPRRNTEPWSYMEILVKQLDNPLPEQLDIKACDEFFEALEAEEVEV